MSQNLAATSSKTMTGWLDDSLEPRRDERLKAAFQPIVNLQTGQVAGFEALARLVIDGVNVPPNRFIPLLDETERLLLFLRMVGLALDFLGTMPAFAGTPYVAVNVEVGLLLGEDFVDLLAHVLDKRGYTPGLLILEILEGERVEHVDLMHQVLERIGALGVRFALDDIGTAYSSLSRIRDLPVDIVKLDQVFARGLDRRPEDLAFMMSIAALARGLEKRLVVEGVETLDALDALTILGIEWVQGYAIAKPMDGGEVVTWLLTRPALGAHRTPQSMLGTYASHLNVVETCRSLGLQPLQMEWKTSVRDWRGCGIGRFFTKLGIHETCCGQAHIRFHEVMDRYDVDRAEWETAAGRFRAEIVSAIDRGHGAA